MNFKICALLALTMSLLGCATANKPIAAVVEPKVEPFNELLITYTPTTYGLTTNFTGRGATGLGGLGGLLGPLGSVAAMLLDQALEAGIAGASVDRTAKLDQKIKANVENWDVNRAQAEYIADKIAKETSLSVHIEALASAASGVAASGKLAEKQVRLELNSVTGYGAGSATDSFKPVIVTKYAVRVGEPERKVIEQELMTVAPQGEATFMTWEGLLSEASHIPEMAGRQLQMHSDKIATRLQQAWEKAVDKAQAAQAASEVLTSGAVQPSYGSASK